VPERKPLVESESPGGRADEKETAHVTGPVPPDDWNESEYGTESVAAGGVGVAIARATGVPAGSISREKFLVLVGATTPLLAASVSLNVKLNTPVALGVPVRTPRTESVRPDGKELTPDATAQVPAGVPDEANVSSYA
jgi:hypothetical protein